MKKPLGRGSFSSEEIAGPELLGSSSPSASVSCVAGAAGVFHWGEPGRGALSGARFRGLALLLLSKAQSLGL